jgi:tetratricopeptide (TPR) repeat protein
VIGIGFLLSVKWFGKTDFTGVPTPISLFFSNCQVARKKMDIPYSNNFDLTSIFIARERQIESFNQLLNHWCKYWKKTGEYELKATPSLRDKLPGLFVIIYGRGGYGKSTLLNHLYSEANDYKGKIKLSKILDWEPVTQGRYAIFNPCFGESVDAQDYFSILWMQLASILEKKPESFKNFQKALKEVEEADQKAASVIKSLQSDDRFIWLRKGVSSAVLSVLREIVPGGKIIINDVTYEKIRDTLGDGIKVGTEQIAILRTKLQEKLGKTLNYYLEPQRYLAYALGRDLTEIAGDQKLLIFFDTYEAIDEVDRFFRLVQMAAGNNVGWVLAGRNNLWSSRDLTNLSLGNNELGYKEIANHELSLAFPLQSGDEFSIEDIVNYFDQINENIHVPPLRLEEIKKLLDITRGIPLAVKIAANIYLETMNFEFAVNFSPIKDDEIVDGMVRRYLIHVQSDMEDRSKLYSLAILRVADNPKVIAAAIGIQEDDVINQYDQELRRLQRKYSFIFAEKEKPTLHEDVRYFLRKWLLERRNQPEVQFVNKRIYTSCQQVIINLEERRKYPSIALRFEDSSWTTAYFNLAEHIFWQDPIEGVRIAIPFLFLASTHSRVLCQSMLDIGNFFISSISGREVIWWNAVTKGFSQQTDEKATYEVLEALQLLENDLEIIGNFLPELYISNANEVKAAFYCRLGEAYLDNDNDQSINYYEKAFSLMPNNKKIKTDLVSTYVYISMVAYNLSNNKEAIEYLEKARTVDPKNVFVLFRIGRTYTTLGEDVKAITYYEEALKLDRNNSEVVRGLSTVYRFVDLNRATEYAKRAVELNPKDPNSLDYLGILYRDQLKIDEAIQVHEAAKRLDPHPTTCFLLGLLFAYKRQYDKAENEFKEALEGLKIEKYRASTRLVWQILYKLPILVSHNQHEEALKVALDMKNYITTERTEKVVIGHIRCLLNVYDCDDKIDLYIMIVAKFTNNPFHETN